jgi:peptidoglycan L-alanyl-D-glutamate endopeptidase CwlK
MAFKLSGRSLNKLKGVDDRLVKVVHEAITLTKVDFGVTYGLRTVEEQKALVAAGKSQTMKSKHLEGKAVDLVAYIGNNVCWELNVYDDVANAMAEAAQNQGVKIRWGAAWHIKDIGEYWSDEEKTMEDAMNEYIDKRRAQGRRPFIDGPHFELS